ncbi:MAG: hypothetical protein LIO99_10245 [Clostridiales bacterium]|nr:hypothetical protein [Clostridiales bacterium]
MKKQVSGKSRTFFIEFLIVLFFFLIIGTICLRVFVTAHKVTRDADALAHAQSTAASIAEVLEVGESIGDYFPDAVLDDSSGQALCYQMTWDSDFAVCSSDSTSVFYTLVLQLDTTDHMQTADMTFTDSSGETLYELTVSYHLALTREEALS